MIKSILFLSALLSLNASAQLIGIKAGLVLSSYNAEPRNSANNGVTRTNLGFEFTPRFTLGGVADFKLSETALLRTGVEITGKGGIETGFYSGFGSSYDYRNVNHFAAIDVPFHLLYRKETARNHQLFFGGGLVPGVLIEGGLNNFDLGAALMVGYQFRLGLNYSLTYNHGLLNVATHSYDYTNLRNRSFALTMGYQFRQKSIAEVARIEAVKKEPVVLAKPVKAFFAELAGPAGLLTLNYDSRFAKSNNGLGFRIGAGPLFDFYSVGISVPVALNYLVGDKTHFFEVDGGVSFFSFKERNQDSWFHFNETNFLVPFVWAGYRFQPLYKKFFFRAGLGRALRSNMGEFFSLPSFSFGYTIQ